mmetsp:Transcript_3150/g.3414  ORF Transcript_3150/g.3414 Transcript_3150/m.3414 type:complete len:311 (+) Transcript_3150:39-971(+)
MRPLSNLRLDPDARLVFPAAGEEKVSQTLKILNSSDESVAWKVRTTAPKAFLVLPRAGVLKPAAEIEVAITLLPNAGENDLRFEVLAAVVNADCDHLERERWAEFPKRTLQVAELRAFLTSRTNGRHSQLRECRDDQDGQKEIAADAGTVDRAGTSWGDMENDFEYRYGKQGEDFYRGGRGPEQRFAGSGTTGFQGRLGSRIGASGEAPFRRPAAVRRQQGEEDEAGTEQMKGASARPGKRSTAERPRPDEGASPAADKGAGNKDSDQPSPMDRKTKAVLAVLIGILVFNLYVRPLIAMAFQSSPSPSPP